MKSNEFGVKNMNLNIDDSSKILIAYYSWSGNIERMAKKIKEIVGGEIFRIEPINKYPERYQDVLKISKEEIKRNYKPPLKIKLENLEKYDNIFIGSPNWYGTIPPPVTTFLSEINFSGKKVIPFISHGGGGKSNCLIDLQNLIPDAIFLADIVVYGRDVKSIEKFIEKITS